MSSPADKETIIVGGGAAGMYCALTLQEAYEPFLMITDRMGGRIMYREDLKTNFGAEFYPENYAHMKKILVHGPDALPSPRQCCCHPDGGNGYGARSPRMVRHVLRSRRFRRYMRKEFIPHYERFKSDCEVMQVKDALETHPFIKELSAMTADRFIAGKHMKGIAGDFISPFVHGRTGSSCAMLSALDYLTCAQGLVLGLKRFDFDEDAMTIRLRRGDGEVEFDTATRVYKRADGRYVVDTTSGKSYTARNVVLATPADVAARLAEPVVKIPRLRNASQLYTHLVRGRMKPRYEKHIVHIFADDSPMVFSVRRKPGLYEVVTERDVDLARYFDTCEIVDSVHWPTALFTGPDIVLEQDLAENLYMAGDHNGPGMEPAAISGIYAANRILGKAVTPDVEEPKTAAMCEGRRMAGLRGGDV